MDAFYDSIAIPILAAIAGAVVAVLLGALVRGGEPRALLTPAIGGAILFVTLWLGYTALDYIAGAQHQAERRALDDRHAALSRQASESALGCLNGLSGEAVENACAGAVFATPQSVAAAVAHAAARLTLLADSVAYAKRFDPQYDVTLADLRHAAENDAFGLYAHVLAVRDGCTAEHCTAFALLADTDTLKTHLRQQVYDHRVAENSLRWLRQVAVTPPAASPAPPTPAPQPGAPSAQVTPPVAAAPVPAPATTAAVPAPAPHGIVPPVASVLPNIDFPSSASIPPVSIMTPEPRASTGAAAAAPQADQADMPPASKPEPVPLPRSAPPRSPPQ